MATSEDDNYDTVRTVMESRCQDKWQKLQNTCAELQEKRTSQAVENETDFSLLYQAKENLLKAQIEQLENCESSFSTEKLVHRELLPEKLTKSVKQLEESKALSHTLYTEAVAELDKEKQLNKQHKSIKATLQEKVSDANSPAASPRDDNAILQENSQKLQSLGKYNHSLLKSMGSFMKKHFPAPDETVTKHWLKKQHVKIDGNDEVVPFEPLQSILEDLMNSCVDTPHDPYIQLDPKLHWQPYVQLLLRCGIAIRHPEEESRIKLTPFHM